MEGVGIGNVKNLYLGFKGGVVGEGEYLGQVKRLEASEKLDSGKGVSVVRLGGGGMGKELSGVMEHAKITYRITSQTFHLNPQSHHV